MQRFAFSTLPLVFLGLACASTQKPARNLADLRPLPRSSIAAVLAHAGELELTDDQKQKLEELDLQREKQAAAYRDEVPKAEPKKGDASSSGGRRGGSEGGMGGGIGGGMGGGMGGGRRGGGQPVETRGPSSEERAKAAEKKIDDLDTAAYLEAEKALSDGQRERAREVAEKYREDLAERRGD